MRLDSQGYFRPTWNHGTEPSDSLRATSEFLSACPGVLVKARSKSPDSWRHPILGPIVSIWEAWSTDPDTRRAGSSGGTITALVSWLLDTGQYHRSTGVMQESADPRRTTAIRLSTKEEALKAAGSRYAPVGAAEMCELGNERDRGIFVGKPCEASAVRQVLESRQENSMPLILSFFCAGTPSQWATDSLVKELGITDAQDRVTSLKYRGDGWPGNFVVETGNGETVSASYNDSWGKHLGPTTQWRCKICPDGVGESADITAGDFWHADERGYPSFEESDGVSVLIARTRRGDELIRQAIAAGVLGAQPADPNSVAGVQPLQVKRRTTLIGRMMGAFLGGRRMPRYQGFRLLRTARLAPIAAAKSVGGTLLRVRRESAIHSVHRLDER
ncbi:Coenzyme F420 hydrogenase/dehydrogenase, beta subunit C-terminal domain [Rhodococcus pyridinivorans]|nr:Coenzyme F420 hydrogenase/dehydrogenase, beta subunit C-terminal domain [Rhodococcus pyridinivorans]